MGNNIRILTNISERRAIHDWHKKTDYYSQFEGGKGLFLDIIFALIMLFKSQKYNIAIVNSNFIGNLFSILMTIFPIRKIPILMIDCLWYSPRNFFLLWLKRIQFKLISRSVVKFVVWASHEIIDYSTKFKIPKEKFIYIPHHHTLEGYNFRVSKGNYIFSGGDGDRDYYTLLEAIKGLSVKVIILTRKEILYNNNSELKNITHFSTDRENFRKLMANSKLVIIPMMKNLLHSGGQQTYLNAMAMGKAVIVADDKGAYDYIKNNINGIIVPSGDVIALRNAIKLLINNNKFANKIANNAKSAYHIFSTSVCINRIIELAENIVVKKDLKKSVFLDSN